MKDKLNAYFVDSKDVVYESAWFNQWIHGADETVDKFQTTLHNLAARSEFGGLRERLVLDRFIVGL